MIEIASRRAMDRYADHKVSPPDYGRIAAELEKAAEFARVLGQGDTAERLIAFARFMRGDLRAAPEVEFLFL